MVSFVHSGKKCEAVHGRTPVGLKGLRAFASAHSRSSRTAALFAGASGQTAGCVVNAGYCAHRCPALLGAARRRARKTFWVCVECPTVRTVGVAVFAHRDACQPSGKLRPPAKVVTSEQTRRRHAGLNRWRALPQNGNPLTNRSPAAYVKGGFPKAWSEHFVRNGFLIADKAPLKNITASLEGL
jgi:hypothetical protein